MSRIELVARIVAIAVAGLGEANRGNPFWTRADAMRAINGSRALRAYA